MLNLKARLVKLLEYSVGLLAILILYLVFLFVFDHEQMLDLIIRLVFGEPLPK